MENIRITRSYPLESSALANSGRYLGQKSVDPKTSSHAREGVNIERKKEYGFYERRPTNRSQCRNGLRPCPWVSCRYNLYLDVNQLSGRTIKENFPEKELWELEETCALDVADKGSHTLEEIGGYLGVTREAVRLIQNKIFYRLEELGIFEPYRGPKDAVEEARQRGAQMSELRNGDRSLF